MGKRQNMRVVELKKHLKACSPEELTSLLIDCYKLDAKVQDMLSYRFKPEGTVEQLHAKCKAAIKQEFYPERGEPKFGLARAKKAISDFSKVTGDEARTLDVMVYYVELGVNIIDDYYGDLYDAFYNSMASMFQQVIEKLLDGDVALVQSYKSRLDRILALTRDSVGDFHEFLLDGYLMVYGEDLEEEEES